MAIDSERLFWYIVSSKSPLPVRPQGPQDWLSSPGFLFTMGKRTYISIDGLNFYYGLVKGTPYRWLDLKSLSVKVLPGDFETCKIKYFTAEVKAFP